MKEVTIQFNTGAKARRSHDGEVDDEPPGV